ncbi:MAG: ribokinase [Candidatus Lokiarchaeota archaeon]|nr:ribokinase [Candidatus Lokiarchaeota archaeon]
MIFENSKLAPYVLIIGSSNMDLNIYSKILPKPGETVTGGIFNQSLGGKGANQSVASVRSGTNTIFIGKIGLDPFGDQMIKSLKENGVNMDYIIRDLTDSSGVAFILIDNKGDNMISVAPGSNSNLEPAEIEKFWKIIKNSKVLVVQMEIPIESIKSIFNIASKGEVIKILNPAPLKPIPREILKNIDIIIPNEGELFKLHTLLGYKKQYKSIAKYNFKTIIKCCKDIGELGPKFIIPTLGSRGCVLYDVLNKKGTIFPSFKVEAIDTVGAGDCFNGVLASQLCKKKSIKESIKYAISASSIAITRRGAQESMPFLDEIYEKVTQYNKIL